MEPTDSSGAQSRWLALAGGLDALQRLTTPLGDDLTLAPFYGDDPADPRVPADPDRRGLSPGASVRDAREPDGRVIARRPWAVHLELDHADDGAVRAQLATHGGRGLDGARVVLAPGLRRGLAAAPADTSNAGDAGDAAVPSAGPQLRGLALARPDSLTALLDAAAAAGVTLWIDAGLAAAPVLAAVLAPAPDAAGAGAGEAPNARRSALAGVLADPLGELLAGGELGQSMARTWGALALGIAGVREQGHAIRVVEASGTAAHDAGAGPAWQVAFAIASGIEALRALSGAGLSVTDAAAAMVLRVAVDGRVPTDVALVRAARSLWLKALRAAGVDPAQAPVALHVRGSRRRRTAIDRWSNLLRGTLEAFVAAAAGADAIAIPGVDDAVAPLDEFAARMAIHSQVLLAHESQLGRVIDPLGGAYAVESLTAAIEARAWAHVREIEAAGGLEAALRAGLVQKALAAEAERDAALVAGRRALIPGVSGFPAPADPRDALQQPPRAAAIPPAAPGDAASHEPQLARLRAAHGPAARLHAAALAWHAGVPLPTISLAMAGEGAPVGLHVVAAPLRRRSAQFEALRRAGDALGRIEAGQLPPRVRLLALAPAASLRARIEWAIDLLAVAGVQSEVVEVAGRSPAEVAVACGGSIGPAALVDLDTGFDARDAADLPAWLAQWRAATADPLWIVGRPAATDAFLAAGVAGLLHARASALALLQALLTTLGATPFAATEEHPA